MFLSSTLIGWLVVSCTATPRELPHNVRASRVRRSHLWRAVLPWSTPFASSTTWTNSQSSASITRGSCWGIGCEACIGCWLSTARGCSRTSTSRTSTSGRRGAGRRSWRGCWPRWCCCRPMRDCRIRRRATAWSGIWPGRPRRGCTPGIGRSIPRRWWGCGTGCGHRAGLAGDSELIDEVIVTAANTHDTTPATDLLAPSADAKTKPEVVADSAYAGAETLADLTFGAELGHGGDGVEVHALVDG